MEVIQPYLKYVLYLIFIIGFLYVNRLFVTDPKMKAWIMSSVSDDNGKPNSKLISGLFLIGSVIIGWFIAIHYGINHTPPEFYFWGVISLIASLFSIREVGKVMTTKYTAPFNGNPNGTTSDPPPVNNSAVTVNNNAGPITEEPDLNKKENGN